MIAAPDYTLLEAREKDEFLNYRGNFTPDERALFHQLCAVWEPLIPYERFVSRASAQRGDSRHAADSLLQKLYRVRLAVVLTGTNNHGDLVPQKIALTEENSRRFVALAVDEFFQRVHKNPENPLPFSHILEDEGLQIPDSFLADVPTERITEVLSEPSQDELQIYRITVSPGSQVIVTSSRIRSFLGLAMKKLRYLLSNANILAAVAREMNSSITALQKNIDDKEPKFWYALTNSLISTRRHLEAQRSVPVTEELFASAEILHAFVEGHIHAFKQRKEAERARHEHIEAILSAIESRDDPKMPVAELRSLLDSFAAEYGDSFETFKSEFHKAALEPPSGRKLAVLNHFGEFLIHRIRLYPVFLERLEALHHEMGSVYRRLMRQHIRGGGGRRITAFYSHDNFCDDIAERLKKHDPLFLSMYQSPEIVSESVVHWATEKGHARDLDQVKKLLQRHFRPGTTKFVELPVLLDLRLNEIYDRAFQDLSALRQILYRLFGRYEAMRERFAEETRKYEQPEGVLRLANTAKSTQGRATSSDQKTAAGKPAGGQPPLQGRNRNRNRGRESQTVSRRSHHGSQARWEKQSSQRVEQKAPKRSYTRKESEEAWQEFKKHLKK